MRTSKVHYIAPSAISITPNANGSHRDLAVYIARGAKIKVHSKGVDRLGVNPETNSYREWQLEGRNRRLADTTGNIPYTIYARLPKSDNAYFLFEKKYDNAYLVFARQYQYENDNEQWFDKYSYVTQEGLAKQYDEQGLPKVVDDENYWWIKLGTVSAVGENGQRTVTLDTGILGTDQYNEEWNLNPDDMPLRVELSCTVDGEDAGPTPYLYWGQSALLEARIVEGWTADASAHVHHWTITRRIGNEEVMVASSDSSDSGSSEEDEVWPGNNRAALFNSSQAITLYHANEENDDFLSAAGAVFKVTAWGVDGTSISDSSDSSSSSSSSGSDSSTDESDSSAEETTYIPLGYASINIYVETNITGTNGDSSIAIFRWYKDGLQPVKPVDTSSAEPYPAPTDHTGSSNVYPESRWSRTAPNRPSEGEWALWMCTSTRHGNGIIEAWSDPVRISGTKGTPGEDAKEREWIYKLGNSQTLPSAPQTLSVVIGTKTVDGHTVDDYVPEGWEDNAQVISQNQRFLYACWRDWNKTTKRWGDFQGPIFWSVWGERGIDGDGVQYVFKLYDHELSNSERTNYIPVKPANMNSNGEWLPASRNSNDPNTAQSWTDDPESPTASLPYCYCSTIKLTGGTWSNYEKLGLWSKWSADGVSQPNYTKTQEAWSNDTVTASETTAPATAHGTTDGSPSHAAEQDWSDSTPSNPNNLPYLWRRSRQMVLNAQTRQYDYATGSNWIYTRLNGTNGTSINTKGTVVCAIKATDSLPAVSGYSTGDLLIKQGNATPYKLTSGQWSQTGMSAAADGDSYTVTKDCTVDLDGDGTAENIKGHLVMWSAEASKWIDLGQFKGESGATYYTHIAWAKVVTLGTPTEARSTGQKTTPNASSVSSASGNFSIGVPPNDSDEWPWMGWLVDQVTADSTNPLLYTWRNVLGPEGNGIASVTRTYARSTQSTSTNDDTPPTGIDTTIGTNGWATTSPAVNEAYPYLWAKELVVYTRHNVTTTKYYMIGARGQNGIDAKDAEWAYVRTKDNVAPEVVDDEHYTDSYSNAHTADDHLPKVKVAQTYDIYGNTHYDANGYKTQTISSASCHVAECTDDPQGVNTDWPYEWEIKRTKGNADANGHRTWNAYSGRMTQHNSLAESTLVMDIDNDSDQFGVDADGKVLTQQVRTTVATLLYGSVEQAFLHDTGNAPTITLYYENGATVPSAVATATISAVTGSDYKQYQATVTVKATGSGSVVFGNGSGQHSGMYVLITGSCAKGGPKSIRFTLTKVMSGASGENPIIYQLAPSGKTFSFARDSLNELTPNARSVSVYVMRTIGNTTTKFTSPTSPETLTNPPTFSWGFDTQTTEQQSNQTIGTAIEISNTQANQHYQVWVQLSTGDRETLPIVKDGTNGATAYIADLDNEMDSISCDNTGYPVTQQTVSTPIHMYYGSGSIGYTVHSVTRNGTTVALDTQSNGVTVSFSDGTMSVAYATTAKIQNGKDEYVITLHPSGVSSNDHSNDRKLTFTVNAVIGYVYNLNPSPSQIRVQSTATSFSGLTCGYKKNINGVVSEHTLPSQSTNGFFIDGRYNIYYRFRQKSNSVFESTYRLFSSSTTIVSLNVATYDAVEFIICTSTSATTSSPQNVIDRETVPVTYDGANGSSDMVQVTCVPGSLTVPFTSAGAVKEATQLTVTLGMTVNGNAATVTSITASKSSNVDIYSNADSGYSTLSNNQRRIVVPADGTVSKADVNSGIVFAITGTYGSKSYTANYTFPMIASEQGGGGQNGEDAWTLMVNPSSVIINQSTSDVNDFGLPKYIDFTAKRGNATATVGNVYNLNSSNLSSNMGLTVSASGNRLQITGYGKVSGSYVTYGRITCTVPLSFTDAGGAVHSTTFTVQIDVYVNLLGTWAVETTNSATTAAGTAIQTALGPNGAITSAYTAAINASAKGLRSEFNEVVMPGGNKNLFGFCKGCKINDSSWPSVPFIQGYGIVVNQNYSSRRRARISNLGTNGVGGCFTVSFQAKITSGTGSLNCNFCDVLPTVGEGTLLNNSQYVAVNTGWQSVELHFDLTDISASTQALLETNSFNGFFDIEDYDGTITNASANIYVRRLKIERGDTATAFCEADEDIAAIGQGQMIAQLTNNGMSYPISNNGRTNVYSVSVNPSSFSSNYVDYLYQNSGFILKSGKVYTLSFWARSSNAGVVITSHLYNPNIITSIGMELYGAEPGAAMESLSGDGGSRVRLSTTWTQYFLRFYVTEGSSTPRNLIALRVEKAANAYTSGGSTYYYSGTVYISDIILQEGYVMDETSFSSLISQNARRISLVQQSGLKRAGIDIENGKITLNADNTYATGSFYAPSVISSNDEMTTTITEGGLEIRSKTTLSYGVFRLNDQGEIILSMYDKNGNRVINLGGTPSMITNGEWVTWKLKKVNQGGNKVYYTTTESDCTTFYQLVLGQVTNTNSSIQYFLPPANNAEQGVETTDSEVKSRNEMVFTSKGSGNSAAALETSIKGLTKISDGYYVKPNDGRFGVDANQNGPTNYWVTLYHFTNGKLDSTYKQQFGL